MLERVFVSLTFGLLCLVGLASSAAASCPAGQVMCSGRCVSLATDEDNCNACGHACRRGHECSAGTCRRVCPDSQLVCGDICVTATLDPRHCGGCGQACANDQYCDRGQCKPIGAPAAAPANACPSGLAMCGPQCRDTKVDPAHCGRCARRCGAGQICEAGTCKSVCSEEAPKSAPKPAGRPTRRPRPGKGTP